MIREYRSRLNGVAYGSMSSRILGQVIESLNENHSQRDSGLYGIKLAKEYSSTGKDKITSLLYYIINKLQNLL